MSRPGQTENENPAFDDVDDEVEDNDTETEESEDSEGEAPALRADGKPFTASDLRALQDALKKARKEARTAKAGQGTTDQSKTSEEDVEARASQVAEAKYKPVVVRTAARAAFAEAGLLLPKGRESAAMARVLGMLRMDEIDITEDGDVDGLDEQIEDIKAELPQLFVSSRRPGRIDGAARESSNGKPKTSADKIAALLS